MKTRYIEQKRKEHTFTSEITYNQTYAHTCERLSTISNKTERMETDYIENKRQENLQKAKLKETNTEMEE